MFILVFCPGVFCAKVKLARWRSTRDERSEEYEQRAAVSTFTQTASGPHARSRQPRLRVGVTPPVVVELPTRRLSGSPAGSGALCCRTAADERRNSAVQHKASVPTLCLACSLCKTASYTCGAFWQGCAIASGSRAQSAHLCACSHLFFMSAVLWKNRRDAKGWSWTCKSSCWVSHSTILQ